MLKRLGLLWSVWVFTSVGCSAPSGDISLQVLSPALSIQRGTARDILVQLDRTGPAAPVQVSLETPPPGVSFQPIEIPVGQTSGTLHLLASDEAEVGDHVLEVIATSSGHRDSDTLSLQVSDIPAGLPIVAALEQQAPLIVEKGKPTEIAFTVDRSGGFSDSFRVELVPPPWSASMEPVTVPYDVTRFTVKLTVDDHLPVNTYPLTLKLSSRARVDSLGLNPQIIGPTEASPQLTTVTPDSFAVDALTHLTLKGTGLSSATQVSLVADNGAFAAVAGITSASSSELQADLRLGGGSMEAVHGQLTVRTPTGTATWSVTLSRIFVDPLKGSDTTGSGSTVSPFASIQRAEASCPVCMPQDVNIPGATCPACTLTLAPGVHHPGSITLPRNIVLKGTGDLYGANPSIIEGTADQHFAVKAATIRQVKITGYKMGLEALRDYRLGAEQLKIYLYPDIADVWVTGGDYGLSTCELQRLHTESAPLRISDNRIAGIHCDRFFRIEGSASWPVEVLRNGDGSAGAGGVVQSAGLFAQDLVASDNQGPGVRVPALTARDSTFRGNEGPGVWATSGLDLGTAASPGGNTFQDNAINLRVDGNSSVLVSAVGNCWNPPAGSDYADTTVDGTCGRIRKPFSRGGTTYIDADGRTQAPFTWTAPPRFNYVLAPTDTGTAAIQF